MSDKNDDKNTVYVTKRNRPNLGRDSLSFLIRLQLKNITDGYTY